MLKGTCEAQLILGFHDRQLENHPFSREMQYTSPYLNSYYRDICYNDLHKPVF